MTDWTPEAIESARANLSPEERAEFDELLDAVASDSLLDFIPATSPKFVAPLHLAPLAAELERSRTEPVRLVVSTPPRHGKTELLLHFIAWLLAHDHEHQVAYITHTGPLALMKSAKARSLARAAGVPVSRETDAKGNWRTGAEEGGVWATSTGGAIVGLGFHTIIVDDPVKGREDAESAIIRQGTYEWFNGDVFNRLEPGGSIIVNMARWHEDDLSGRLSREGWKHINLQALCEDANDPLGRALGEPLWPERWSVAALEKIRAQSEYDWVSLYQGTPRTREGKLFEGVKTYAEAPKTLSIAIGVDLAYTAKTSSDWSVAVVLGEHNGFWYVLRVLRRQMRAGDFAKELLALQKQYPAAVMRWYCSTTEMGSADLLKLLGVRISGHIATTDKYVRAQGVAAAWKAGRVLVPATLPPGMKPEELSEFLRVVQGFTGIGDLEDDDVDALAPAYDMLPARIVVPEPAIGSREYLEREAQRMLEAARARAQQNARVRNGAFVPNDPLLKAIR